MSMNSISLMSTPAMNVVVVWFFGGSTLFRADAFGGILLRSPTEKAL